MSGVIEPRDDGFHFAIADPEGEIITDWIGPYETSEAAQAAFTENAETLITDMVKKALGLE